MMSSLQRRLFLTSTTSLLLVPLLAVAAESRLAIKGYDPVAYFTQSKPVEGVEAHSLELDGARWRFANAENMELFRSDPDRYAPQYSGYCAFGVAIGKKLEIDPRAWAIVDGKLYLNYSLDTQKQWQAEQSKMIAQADQNWPSLRK